MPTVPTILRRFHYVLVVDPNAKFTSEVFLAFVKSMGECLIVGSAYHRNTKNLGGNGAGAARGGAADRKAK